MLAIFATKSMTLCGLQPLIPHSVSAVRSLGEVCLFALQKEKWMGYALELC